MPPSNANAEDRMREGPHEVRLARRTAGLATIREASGQDDGSDAAKPIPFSTRGEPLPTLGIDPLADLLFGVVAIVVLAVIIILPTVGMRGMASAALQGPVGEALIKSKFSLDGRAVEPLVATAAGLRYGPQPSEIVPLEAILQDAPLAARLRAMRERGDTLVLMIDPDGSEAAFQFEAVASRDGPPRIRQVRLDATCTHAKSAALARFCLAQSNGTSSAP
jgi:hypothetical protein